MLRLATPCRRTGKTAIAKPLAAALKDRGLKVERLDGDIVRRSLASDLGFTKEDRDENIKRVTFVAKLLTRNGVKVLATFVSPYRERRRKSREEIGEFMEVYVRCSVEECMRRDVKGMYMKAMAGEITGFTGVDDPYEEPQNPELVLDTDDETVEESVGRVLEKMESLGYLE